MEEHQQQTDDQQRIEQPEQVVDELRYATELARTIGDRDDRDFSDEITFIPKAVTLPSYTVVALAGDLGILRRGGSASPDVVLTARVDNLFDRKFQQVFGFASPRRAFLIGARFGIAK